ncbi:hypothetical protein BDB00DRAFT_932105 [Zychaea mexicana]|uniref:uncharacterized protein n=1 Tax=Zychaea mexicana TaxID=64656 RepID=UPI0022FEB886|nr:uncharacterized protein BDB00DRAFT_932105 [Zychaea mexicana]KAI9489208.1 hypothetical protein BDB00DRAFT_932105 [Zychaea mexicana]
MAVYFFFSDNQLGSINLQTVIASQELREQRRLYYARHAEIPNAISNFQQEIRDFLNEVVSTFPVNEDKAEKILWLIDDGAYKLMEYLRCIDQNIMDIGGDEKTSLEEESEAGVMSEANTLLKVIQYEIDTLYLRLQRLKSQKQELERLTAEQTATEQPTTDQ